MATHLIELSPGDMSRRLGDALAVYVDAMRYPRGTEDQRASMWLEHTRRKGWKAVAAVESPDGAAPPDGPPAATAPLLGIAYGYSGAPDQWWQQQVVSGLRRSGADPQHISELMTSYFELTELHIHPRAQGRGLGEALIRRLLEDREERHVLLSTPEINGEANRAWRLYRRLGFADVIRDYHFAGDPRAFAILGRGVPLEPYARGSLIWHDDLVLTRHRTRRRLVALVLLLLVLAPSLIGCVRVRTSLTVSSDDRVSGQIVAAAKPRDNNDKGPQLLDSLPFAQKVAVSEYSRDDYVGSQAVFSDLTFAELPQLAGMNRDAAGVDISLRRAGDLVILEGRADLTSLSDPEADVSLSVSFPGEVTSTNGEQISSKIVEWRLRPGVVSTMNAQARYTDPSARSFTGAAIWLGVASFLAAGVIAWLAYNSRDRSPRPGEPQEQAQ